MGKTRFVKRGFIAGTGLCAFKPSEEAMKMRKKLLFFQAVKARLCKFEGDRHEGKDQYDSVIKVSSAQQFLLTKLLTSLKPQE